MTMNIEQLSYIVEVAKTKSLADAAKTLNISQSALSQAITKLENELKLKIFSRTRTGAITTKEGDKIIEKAHYALDAIYEIKEEAHRQMHNLNDLLRISTIPGLTTPIIDTFILFKNNHPNLKIEVNEKASLEITEDIRRNNIDIGFIAINKANMDQLNDLYFSPVISGKLLLFSSKETNLDDTTKVITAEVLKKQTFVLYKDEYVQNFITSFQKLYGPVDIFLRTTNIDVITKAVTELGAVTIGHDISTIFDPSFPSKKMKTYSIGDFSDTSFRFGWVRKNDYKLSYEAKIFIEEINNILLKNK